MPKSENGRAPDATSLLEKDHETVRKLLARLEKARSAAQRTELFTRIRAEVVAHSGIEEEIFYPAFHNASRGSEDEKMFFEAAEEHHLVDLVMAELERADVSSDPFAAKSKVLKDLIEHHAEEEEDEMFPRARKLLGKDRLQELGARMKERKKEILGEESRRASAA